MIKNPSLKQNNSCSFVFRFVLFSVFIFVLLWFNLVQAAELKILSSVQEFAPGQQFQIDLMLDTEGETINAVEGEIVFPGELLEIKEIRDGDSIINLWVERASINPTGTIAFSGIIPAGFAGVLSPYYEGERPGKIFSLIFKTKTTGDGVIDLKEVKVLLNDGLGTPAETTISNFQFSISKTAAISELQILKDTEPPEDFKPEIAKDPNIFEGKWFLVFATQDKGSGIDYYAIHESTRKKEITRISTKKWLEAESPYLLKDQKLKSYIYVKAIDKAGNERITSIEPQYPLNWYEKWWLWGIIILGAIILYFIVRKVLWIRHTKRH